ncbi:putative transcription factor capicua [Drosophila kikkawai]|uniref:Transcription factor capicua n=1 Tax=Drosophila kikkawai TaxID=30033 RepID=A0A6P4J3T1_DROKI|nr:putative transcription factor capicua [Drosophila kikkawai]
MINAAAGQQVTPAGAAIKLHFACNNNNNNSNNSSSNYSGLKTMEHKMSDNNNNNNNNNINNRWQKIELIRRQLSGEAAAAAPAALSTPAPSIPPQPMGFYKPTLGEESEDHLSKSVTSAPSPTSAPAASGEYRSLPGLGPILWAINSEARFEDAVLSFPVSAYSAANAFQGAFKGITGATVAATKRFSPGGGTAKATPTATSLRWLSMPVPKEKPSLAKAASVTIAAGQPKSPGGAAARSALLNPQPQRTEDQENAFRRIEDVHNYAKLQDCSSDDADDDDDDVDEEEEEEEEQEQELGEDEEEEEEEGEGEGEGIQVQLPVQQVVTRIRREDTEEHVDVDVVTVPPQEQEHKSQQPQQQQDQASAVSIRPEHHARRPMNAFLIFCKRHRAIVKERYKTLENRAITKILGDWWAALDDKEKQCFTDLAQQNKDAFFNANPNFKWYKLPAPPLRTLATRPSNAATGGTVLHSSEDQSQQEAHPTTSSQQLQLQWAGGERGASGVPLALLRRNYFKLADETQMGDLSSLLQVQVQVPEKDYALQQVLSETSQFLSAHMPLAGNNKTGSGGKRSLPDSNSSNSSEEEAAAVAAGLSPSKKAKTSRSCKGKIYQELVNSGQLSAIAKSKSKAPRSPSSANLVMLGGGGNFTDISLDAAPNTPPVSPPERHNDACSPVHLRSVSESSSSGFFDLEEKIKELPALSLDAYLQRKRSTKKKKKFSGSKKQRNSNSTSGVGTAATPAVQAAGRGAASVAATSDQVRIKQQQQAAAAVGSQRRKARKESITRRDVSAIEQEVASILPLTINGCYYFDQSDAPRALSNNNVNGNATSLSSSPSSSSSPPLSSNSSSSSTSLSLSSPAAYDVMTSSTSDLLILAEVAANRTELNSKSN